MWATLVDLPSYSEWNPRVTAASGDVREGERIDVTVKRRGSRSRRLRVEVTTVDEPRTFRWVGVVGVPWLFRGEHSFELEPIDGDRTRVVSREAVSGVLVPFVVPDEAERDYEAANEALVERVEGRAAAASA